MLHSNKPLDFPVAAPSTAKVLVAVAATVYQIHPLNSKAASVSSLRLQLPPSPTLPSPSAPPYPSPASSPPPPTLPQPPPPPPRAPPACADTRFLPGPPPPPPSLCPRPPPPLLSPATSSLKAAVASAAACLNKTQASSLSQKGPRKVPLLLLLRWCRPVLLLLLHLTFCSNIRVMGLLLLLLLLLWLQLPLLLLRLQLPPPIKASIPSKTQQDFDKGPLSQSRPASLPHVPLATAPLSDPSLSALHLSQNKATPTSHPLSGTFTTSTSPLPDHKAWV